MRLCVGVGLYHISVEIDADTYISTTSVNRKNNKPFLTNFELVLMSVRKVGGRLAGLLRCCIVWYIYMKWTVRGSLWWYSSSVYSAAFW
jgi:hypothetical protein